MAALKSRRFFHCLFAELKLRIDQFFASSVYPVIGPVASQDMGFYRIFKFQLQDGIQSALAA